MAYRQLHPLAASRQAAQTLRDAVMRPKYHKTILTLANSRKNRGHCVAGRETTSPSAWVRPIGAVATGELLDADCQFKQPHTIRLLDIVSICMQSPKPHQHQTENHVVDRGFYWHYEGSGTWNDAYALRDQFEGPLWFNGLSSYSGENDRMSAQQLVSISDSLKLIEVQDLLFKVSAEAAYRSDHSLKVRGFFTFSGQRYALKVTDPEIEQQAFAKGAGEYNVGRALLCLSLGEVFGDGYAYKLIAGVLIAS